jgi:hypothetical protein
VGEGQVVHIGEDSYSAFLVGDDFQGLEFRNELIGFKRPFGNSISVS